MFFGGIRKIKFILYTGFIIAAMFLSWSIVRTETQTGNIDINMTVPSAGGGGGGGGGGGETYAPEIINIVSTTNFYQAVITWEVNFKYTDGINTTSIFYGKGDYVSSTAVIASGTKFSAILEGLETDTVYTFKIEATNKVSLKDEEYRSFKTEKAKILKSLTILAKPEKRDLKNGLNYSAEATLFFLDQTGAEIKFEDSFVLDASGTTTLINKEVTEGTAMIAMLKTDSHLAKRLNGINTTGETLILDFTENNSFYLLAGDLAGNLSALGSANIFAEFLQAARQDDFVDIMDVSTVVSKFNDDNQVNERANLNGDYVVDAQDISMVLSNFRKKGNIWNN